jgi:hypothetical protein
LDAALQKLLAISGVLFVTWFFVQLKDILVRWDIVAFLSLQGNHLQTRCLFTGLLINKQRASAAKFVW